MAVLITMTCFVFLCGCEKKHEAYVSSSTEIRDNTPRCLVPEAPGTETHGNELVTIDTSNASEGYMVVTYLGESKDVKLQITGSDNMTYTYDIHDNNPETFPISTGTGAYTVGVFELIDGYQYAVVYNDTLNLTVTNEMGAFLYPNQYVRFNQDSKVVGLASELVAPAHDDLEAINYVYNYVIANVTYDHVKAENIESGYIPTPDDTLESKTGICLDYAALMTSMLRSQQIPTRMEVGYAGTAYHAWISVYAENIGWINGIIEFDGTSWSLMDPTFASNAGEEKAKSFIGDGENYLVKYIY